jgi:hypothetical protein
MIVFYIWLTGGCAYIDLELYVVFANIFVCNLVITIICSGSSKFAATDVVLVTKHYSPDIGRYPCMTILHQ